MDSINIIIAGVGGQGNILSSSIIAEAAVNKGNRVILSETFGAAQRGGAVSSHIRISKTEQGPLIPAGKCDILLGFEPLETLRHAAQSLSKNGIVVYNTQVNLPINTILGEAKYPETTIIHELLTKLGKKVYSLDATKLSQQAGNAITMNMVMLGALIGTGLTPLTMEDIKQSMRENLPPNTFKMNLKAFDLGYNEVSIALNK